MHQIDFEEEIGRITQRDPRFHRNAYHFLKDALDYTQEKILKKEEKQPRHVSGGELLDGIREYALEQFGPMALTVLNEWGISETIHFGHLVFNMIEQGLLSKTESDSLEDFRGGYDFYDAFQKPFLPVSRRRGVDQPAPPLEPAPGGE